MARKSKILIVDDTEINRALLSDVLSPTYDILEADNGAEAVNILRHDCSSISLVLLDIVMPVMDGFEVLSVMRKNGWLESIPVVMISAEVSSSHIDHAYNLGATDYITRPFDENTVLRRVQNSILLYAKQKSLENLVTEQIMEKERTNYQMVEILSNIVEFRNGESGLHVLHIRVITEMVLQDLRIRMPELGLTAQRISLIANASALHDIGKISIPTEVLNKPGRLTKEEFETMKTHTVIGAQMLENTPAYADSELIQISHDICRWHHERYDGRGYPDGLVGDQIPIAAQVVALADVYDALTSQRVYKPAIPHKKAVEMIVAGECGAFNPRLLDCFLAMEERIEKNLQVRSPRSAAGLEVRPVVSELLSHDELRISGRTMALLEQERLKSRFYASLSQEVLFEYDRGTDILEISEWGAHHLDVPELIPHPTGDPRLLAWGAEAIADLSARCLAATHQEPTVSVSHCLHIHGGERWYKIMIYTLWDSEDAPQFSRLIGKLVDVHEEHTRINELQDQAFRDSLTGLYNLSHGREIIQSLLREHPGEPFALLMVDMDYFKAVNDQYGHDFGNQVLCHVAQNIRKSVRDRDVVSRFGGDEFLIFLSLPAHSDLAPIVARIHTAISSPYEGLTPSLSMGVAVSPQDGEDFDKLFSQADRALYAVKEDGRGTYRFFSADIPDFPSSHTPIDS